MSYLTLKIINFQIFKIAFFSELSEMDTLSMWQFLLKINFFHKEYFAKSY